MSEVNYNEMIDNEEVVKLLQQLDDIEGKVMRLNPHALILREYIKLSKAESEKLK